jgi:hypothetical protein
MPRESAGLAWVGVTARDAIARAPALTVRTLAANDSAVSDRGRKSNAIPNRRQTMNGRWVQRSVRIGDDRRPILWVGPSGHESQDRDRQGKGWSKRCAMQ